jgi:PKD repeat protein
VTDTSWTETGITYDNAPAPGGALANAGVVGTNGSVDVDLGSGAIPGNGTYTFAITGNSSDTVDYLSRQSSNPPQLVVSEDTGGGGGGTTAPAASFTATPTSGTAPLTVSFTDTSTGSPTAWSWNFGDGATSTAQHPSHQYTSPGTYNVSMTASNAGGTSSPATAAITVGSAPGVGGTTASFTPVADTYVRSGSPTEVNGSKATLRVRGATSEARAFLRFDVSGLSGSVQSVKLRLQVSDPSPDGGDVRRVLSNTWDEATTSWNTQPAIEPGVLGAIGNAATGAWVEVDVTAYVTGNGTWSFALADASSSDYVEYLSSEGAAPPQLVITTA